MPRPPTVPTSVLLVIFGAGASYDSAPSYPAGQSPVDALVHPQLPQPYRPPLADELFDDRLDFKAVFARLPECLSLITNLRHRGKDTTVEQALEFYASETREYPARHEHLMAIRYALQELLRECVAKWSDVHGGVTSYATLLDHIERWRPTHYKGVLIVTFNYDTMIEDALRSVKITITSMKDYVRHDTYKLVKIHGSVNWARVIAEPSANSIVDVHDRIANAARVKVADDWGIAEGYPTLTLTRGGVRVAAVPSMVLPLRTKAEFECPDDQLQTLEDFLPQVRKVLVIGWRAQEPHFTELLRKHLKEPEWHIVAGSTRAAKDVANALKHERVGGPFSVSPGGFSDFVRKRETYEILRPA